MVEILSGGCGLSLRGVVVALWMVVWGVEAFWDFLDVGLVDVVVVDVDVDVVVYKVHKLELEAKL